MLVLDEPTFGQDSTGAGELLAVLDGLNAAGATIVVITHDLQLVADHASPVAVLADGGLLGAGATDDVLLDDALLATARLPQPRVRHIAEAAARRDPAWERVLRFAELP